MRFATVAAAVCLGAWLTAVRVGAEPPPQTLSADSPATAIRGPGSPAGSSSGDAAARHAKRAACLKDAKIKKLVGAEKTSFLKNCVAAP